MFRTFALSLTAAAAIALGAAASTTPASAGGLRDGGLYVPQYGKSRHWRGQKRYWRKGDRWRAARYNKMYHRRAMREHYPYNCYWSHKSYRVGSRDYYGDWYRKTISRPVHKCR